MVITVAICTWNRAEMLDQTLAEMCKLSIPDGVEWELLVVNNNCTDNTDEVIARHADTLPLRRLFEPKQGLSNSRNCAVDAAKGDLIIWTDDDVLVDKQWITAYHEAALRYPEASFFGGRILPWFEGTPPRWLEENWRVVGGAFAVRDLGLESLQFTKSVVPYGANYALRREVQLCYRYDPKLGRKGTGMLGGEETVVIGKMLSDSLEGRWIPDAKVRHFIPQDRQTVRYLRRYYRGFGEYLAKTVDYSGPMLLGQPRWPLRASVESEVKYQISRLFGKPETWIGHLIRASIAQGQFIHFKS